MKPTELHIDTRWLEDKRTPVIIAGPCSVESEEQLVKTVESFPAMENIVFIRAGIWKPRSRPHSFEGIGEKGLEWLAGVKNKFNLPVAIEAMTPHHVKLAVQYGLDGIWIGARTTVNPFFVNELAKAMEGQQEMVVFIKNPINPDINLWIGAIERFYAMGIRKIVAIHRGFSLIHATPYRNEPVWDIPLRLKQLIPSLPIFCDPSHIAGDRQYIVEISQRALQLGMKGLMIETHHQPSSALSDSEQQLTPKQLNILIDQLTP